ncbi:MAG: methyltetrahydrofolate cobalamin methyltransferase [Deltaproteobacteria bacterium]|nr:methyltetrahydrofolate cobalamin methyltransferase [Deltaproteobacteria bacterium]
MEIIGEKINTTLKAVGKAVQERDAAFIQNLASRQAESGATYLDVNSGLALYPEEEAQDFAWLVSVIQAAVDLPLCIDSCRPQAIESALKHHKGQAMVNSVNGDPLHMEAIFPLVKKYGCKVIALTSSKEKGIPKLSTERMKIAETIVAEAVKYGISVENIYFDPLVLPISTDQKSALVFLETVKEIKRSLRAKTISGLSNISYGLPRRRLINHAFLMLALGTGLDAAILDPTDKAIMGLVQTVETLMDKDPYCMGYLKAYREGVFDV